MEGRFNWAMDIRGLKGSGVFYVANEIRMAGAV